jgi:hypothetical protein
MKRIFAFAIFVLLSAAAFAQIALPNLTYNASLNAACATPNAFCVGSVFTSNSTTVQTGQAGNALDVPSNNYALATVTVSGTYAGATIAFDFSDPSGGTSYFQMLCTRTDVNIIEVSEILPSNQTRAWQCPVFASWRFRVRVSAISTGSLSTWITLTQSAVDPSPTEANLPAASSQATSAFSNSVQSALTTSVNIKASTGNVYGVSALNGAASSCWIQFINSATAGTLGTNVIFSIPLPASTTQPVQAGPNDIALGNFPAGIAVGIATTANGSTACGTAGQVTIFYN